MLLGEIGYVVEVVSISGRTTAVMRQLLSRLMTHPLLTRQSVKSWENGQKARR